MNKYWNLVAVAILSVLTGCVTNKVSNSESTTQNISKEDPPDIEKFVVGRWEGRNLYDFFEAIYDEGVSVSAFTNEIFSTAPYNGIQWEVVQASRGMNVIGVDIPYPSSLDYNHQKEKWLKKWNEKIPFPIDKAKFVINRWSDLSYLEGQKFNQYVMFSGYEDGFIQYTAFGTNEVSKLCFLNTQGVADIIKLLEEDSDQ